MAFPLLIYVTIDKDGKMAVYDSEESVPAPFGSFAEVATYTLDAVEEFKRQVVMEKRPTGR